jgi:hypothetical protein
MHMMGVSMMLLGPAEEYVDDDSLKDVLRELSSQIVILPISFLKPHEDVDPGFVRELAEDIKRCGLLKKPIVVDSETLIIIDGHHRVEALKRLGCRRIPCLFVNYRSPRIAVLSWRGGEPLSKELVLNAGLRGELLPPKTTRHIIMLHGKTCHISEIQFDINIPYKELIP